MKILLGTLPIGQGQVQSIQEYSDGSVRLAFKLVSGKDATLIMAREEVVKIHQELSEILTPVQVP